MAPTLVGRPGSSWSRGVRFSAAALSKWSSSGSLAVPRWLAAEVTPACSPLHPSLQQCHCDLTTPRGTSAQATVSSSISPRGVSSWPATPGAPAPAGQADSGNNSWTLPAIYSFPGAKLQAWGARRGRVPVPSPLSPGRRAPEPADSRQELARFLPGHCPPTLGNRGQSRDAASSRWPSEGGWARTCAGDSCHPPCPSLPEPAPHRHLFTPVPCWGHVAVRFLDWHQCFPLFIKYAISVSFLFFLPGWT